MKIQFPKNYIVWDLETSGLDPVKDYILELGIVEVKDGVVVSEENFIFNNDIKISELTTNLTGITQEMCDNGIIPHKTLIDKLEYIATRPHVSHNGLRFDLPFLLAKTAPHMVESHHSELARKLYKNCIDTAVLFKAQKMGRMRRVHETFAEFGDRVMDERVYGLKYNVKVCCDELGINMEGVQQHRALADILLTNEIYKKITS